MPRVGLIGRTAGFNVATALTGAVVGILLARWLGPSDRGHYAAVVAYFGIAVVVSELGIASSVVYFASRTKERAADYVLTALAIFVPLGLAAMTGTAGFAILVLDSDDPLRGPLLIIVVAIAVSLVGTPPSFALQALSIPKWNIIRLAQPAIMLPLILLAGILADLKVSLVIWLMTAALALQSSLAWYFYLAVRQNRGKVSRTAVRPMVYFGLANAASTAPNSFNARLDQLVLAFLVSPASLGQYAVAVSLSLLAGPMALAFGNVAFPGLASGGDPDQTIRSSIRGSFRIAVLVVAPIAATGPFVVPVVFGDGYEDVPLLLVILAPGAVFFVVNTVIGDLLRGLGRPGRVAVCEWIGLIGTLLGLLVTVRLFGAVGAAFTSSGVSLVVHVLLRVSLRSVRGRLPAGGGAVLSEPGHEADVPRPLNHERID